MKSVLFIPILCMVMASPSAWAASCSDTQSAATAAIKERNTKVKETHNAAMPDPEEDRGTLSGCLGTVASLGDAFSLGVSIPSMDSIISGMCRQVDSYLQNKMNDALNEARSNIADIGRNNPFQVSGKNDVSGMLRKIK